MSATRCDLHLHSAASIGNDEWYTRFFGCPESYAEPVEQYELCKARGMSLVTLTDHDTIAGGLQLVDRPDFFLSEEVTAIFPENGCIMHVLTWNITQAQHEEIQARRRDIYRLCEYLDGAGIAHGLAHPLLSPNWKLDADIVEKVLLLFPDVRGRQRAHGSPHRARPRRHPRPPHARGHRDARGEARHRGARPHAPPEGAHGRLRRPRAPTQRHRLHRGRRRRARAAAFVARCMAGEGRLVGHQAHIDAMAMSVKHTTYHHLKQRQDENVGYRNPFVDMIDLIAGRDPEAQAGAATDGGTASGFVASLLRGRRARRRPARQAATTSSRSPRTSPRRTTRASSAPSGASPTRCIEGALGDLLAGAQDFDLYRIFGAVRDLAGGLVTAAPMFFAADHFGKQEQAVRRLWKQWTAFELPPRPERLGVFTDSLAQVDGVSTWCKRFLGRARAEGREVARALLRRAARARRGSDGLRRRAGRDVVHAAHLLGHHVSRAVARRDAAVDLARGHLARRARDAGPHGARRAARRQGPAPARDGELPHRGAGAHPAARRQRS